MKVLELNLLAFGIFSGLRLDLSGGEEGVHVVYGSNEAGKSTALAALRCALYGFGHRTTYDFEHEAKKLRVGLCLRGVDGERLEVVRRKGRSQTLLDPSGQPLGDSALVRHLGGVDEDTFRRMFALNYAALVEGAKALLAGGGDLGGSLLAAGLGGQGLRELQREIEEGVGKLFLPRGSKPQINQAYGELKEARSAIGARSLKARDWEEVSRQIEEREAELGTRKEALRSTRSRLARAERIGRLLPRAARLRHARAELEALGEVRDLSEGFAQSRRELEGRRRVARQTVKRLQEALEENEAAIAALGLPAVLLAERAAVDALYEELGRAKKNRLDLLKRRGERESALEEAGRILRELDPSAALDRVEDLRLTQKLRAGLRRLAKEGRDLRQRLRSGREVASRLEADRRRLQEEEGARQEAQDPAPLSRARERARDALRAEAEWKKKVAEARDLRRRAGAAVGRLRGFEGSAEELAGLSLPGVETLDRLGESLKEARAERSGRSKDLEALRDRARDTERRLEELAGKHAVPSEAELGEARALRAQTWSLVRRAWLDREDVVAAARDLDPERELPEAFEERVATADAVSDRLRREADRVQERAALEAQAKMLEDKAAEGQVCLDAAEKALADVEAEWNALWAPLGVLAFSPREMRPWLSEAQGIVAALGQAEEVELQAGVLEQEVDEARAALVAELRNVMEEPPAPSGDLSGLVGEAEDRIASLNAARDHAADLARDLGAAEKALRDQGLEREQVERAIEGWEGEWSRAVTAARLPADTEIEEVDLLLDQHQELFKQVDEARKLAARIHGIEGDLETFEEETRGLCRRIGAPSLGLRKGAAAEEALRFLKDRVDAAVKEAERRETLGEAKEKQERNLEEARARLEEVEQDLEEIYLRAGTSDPEALQELERRWAEGEALGRTLRSLEDQILEDAAGAGLEEVLEELASVDADTLPARIQTLGERIEAEDAARMAAREALGSLRKEREHMQAQGTALEAAQEAESALARIREGVERYLPLRIAQILLSRFIETYRERHQGPLVRRAGELFAMLTLGSFTGLRSDYGAGDKPVLVGVRPGGATVGVEAMSAGTRDQLYLALRLASLELYLDGDEALPFVLDDIFIHFDDDRARSGLKVLGTLARRTQVVLFTHHARLVELAREAVPREQLFTHELGSAGS